MQQTKDWVEFSKQGTVLALHPAKEKKKLTKNISMLIGFNVNELETVCSDLEKKKENTEMVLQPCLYSSF